MSDQSNTAAEKVWADLQAAGGSLAARCGLGNHVLAIPANEVDRLDLQAQAARWAHRAHAAIDVFLTRQDQNATVAELRVVLMDTTL
jgi:hypothetical protein